MITHALENYYGGIQYRSTSCHKLHTAPEGTLPSQKALNSGRGKRKWENKRFETST
jgi:hypothetical protein